MRIRALDGLRGVAILLVVAYHAWPTVVPSGGYGVTVFFVLSGFLITGLLLREDHVDYKRFYWNRAVRLLPALVLALVGFVVIFGRWEPVLWVAGYAANYGKILGGDVGALSHAWSLAVEEHFYLVWPVVIGFTPRRFRWPVVVSVFAAAAVWRVVQSATADSWRVVMGSDTAAYALLAGCVLAVALHENRLKTPSRFVTGAAVAVIVAAGFLPLTVEGFVWVELPVVGLAAFAVAGCLQRTPILETRVLVWFGTVSYGLYLWHFLILQARWFHPATAIGVSMAVAWLSYRFVEQPFRRRLHLRPRTEDSGFRSGVVTQQPSGLVGSAGKESGAAHRRQLEPRVGEARI